MTQNTVNMRRKPQPFTLSSLRAILPAAARALSGPLGMQLESVVCYCPRVQCWYEVTRIIPNGTIRYLVRALRS